MAEEKSLKPYSPEIARIFHTFPGGWGSSQSLEVAFGSTGDAQLEILADKVATYGEFVQYNLDQREGISATTVVFMPAMPFVGKTTTEAVTHQTSEVFNLRQRVQHLENLVENLVSSLEEKVIVLRTLNREDAKQEIIQLFQGEDVLDYGDIAENLRIDLSLVVDLCNELEKEGLIGSPS